MPTIPEKVVLDSHNYLIRNKDLLTYLCNKRGINKKAILKYQIGYDKGRYTIPIRNALNETVNIRKWSDKIEPKILSYDKGYGENRVFPIENLKQKKKRIIICEGEWDCVLLNQYGFYAVTSTCGVSSWKDEWNNYFFNKDVYIIFDCDEIGRKFAKELGEKLIEFVNSLKVIDLKLDKGEDVTDWFVKYKKDEKQLVANIKKTENLDVYKTVNLGDGLKPQFYNKKIKFHGIVVGKDLSPYLVPKKIKAICSGCGTKKAEICPLGSVPYMTVDYSYNDYKDSIVKFINSNDAQIKGIIRKDLMLPAGEQCKKVQIEIEERQSLEDISIIPEVNFEHERVDEKEYVNRKAYVFGNSVQTNQSYLLRGTTWSDPKNQMGIHLVTEMKGSRDNISKFVIDEEVKDKLKLMRPTDPQDVGSIWNKLEDIYTDFTYNVTHIYGRHNVIMATDLAYHSVIDFNFLDRPILKGWLECAIIGDTRTGKTETIKHLVHHYKAGEFLTSGENTTRSGILGGAQQHNGRWTLTWGKIPLNDRRLLVIDEADNLKECGLMGQLSGVRSSGIAEVVMIQTQKTTARTRLIWIANPMKHRISEHNYGVDSIKEIFGKQQDISRIDFAVICAKEEVDKATINKIHKERYPHKYTSSVCHACIMWVWNRNYNDVVWADGAEQLILNEANKLGDKYSPDIPLLIDAEARMKLARMSVALAARLFSTDESCEKVVVYPAHVKVISQFLQRVYDDKYMGYRDFSERKIKGRKLKDESYFNTLFYEEENIDMFLEMQAVQTSDIEDIFNCDRDGAKQIIRELRRKKAINKVSWYYKKSPTFIFYLKKRKEELRKNF